MNEEATLTDPLLSPSHQSRTRTMAKHPEVAIQWPEAPVPLFLPQEWQTKDQKATECVYLYDAAHNLLKLVERSNHDNVIDVLDPEDIIGASVEINISEGATAPRVTTTPPSESEDRPANAPPTDTLTDTQGHAVLTIFAYPRRDPNHAPDTGLLRWCGMGQPHASPNPNYKRPQGDEWEKYGNRYAFHRHLKVVPSEDSGALAALVQAIRQAAGLSTTEQRGRALVIVNPKSGPKQIAEEVYDNVVNVLLEQAGIEHDLMVTEYAKHPTERISKGYEGGRDILDYSMLISVGGDGIAHECLQGLRARDDCKEILASTTIGFIGAGTSNGMAKSIARTSQEQSSPLDAAFLVAKGHTRNTDLSEYQTTSQSYWSFLTFSWAWISNIDVDSEVLRSLGPLRFDLWGVYEVLRMKKHRAKFSYLPAKAKRTDTIPAIADEIKEPEWVVEEDDFFIFWASHVPDAAENAYSSPPSKIDDGIFQIWVVRAKNASRLQMAKILISMEKGGHHGMPGVEFIECHAYRLEPADGINDLDGEVVEAGSIQARVMPGAMKVFCK